MENINFTGHFLIAMPALDDPFFAKSVIFICTHNQDGAMGLVINRPTDIRLSNLLTQMQIDTTNTPKKTLKLPIHNGGPVQVDRGFILHQSTSPGSEGQWNASIATSHNTLLTSSRDILEASAQGAHPPKMLIALGYAGWNQGQLETEMARNDWLSIQAKSANEQSSLLYDLSHDEKFSATLALMGLNLANLSEVAGHA